MSAAVATEMETTMAAAVPAATTTVATATTAAFRERNARRHKDRKTDNDCKPQFRHRQPPSPPRAISRTGPQK
jgi:hypothetical protein